MKSDRFVISMFIRVCIVFCVLWTIYHAIGTVQPRITVLSSDGPGWPCEVTVNMSEIDRQILRSIQ